MSIAALLAGRMGERAGWLLALAPLAAFAHFLLQMPLVADRGWFGRRLFGSKLPLGALSGEGLAEDMLSAAEARASRSWLRRFTRAAFR